MSVTRVLNRRFKRSSTDATPLELVEDQVLATDHQLTDARTRLIAARRRVSALESAAERWHEFRNLVRTRGRARGAGATVPDRERHGHTSTR